jgi:hypothetical protein
MRNYILYLTALLVSALFALSFAGCDSATTTTTAPDKVTAVTLDEETTTLYVVLVGDPLKLGEADMVDAVEECIGTTVDETAQNLVATYGRSVTFFTPSAAAELEGWYVVRTTWGALKALFRKEEINNINELLVGDVSLESLITAVDGCSDRSCASDAVQLAGATVYPPSFSDVLESGGYAKVRTTWGKIKSLFR